MWNLTEIANMTEIPSKQLRNYHVSTFQNRNSLQISVTEFSSLINKAEKPLYTAIMYSCSVLRFNKMNAKPVLHWRPWKHFEILVSSSVFMRTDPKPQRSSYRKITESIKIILNCNIKSVKKVIWVGQKAEWEHV
jgi:hypothetical protein